MKINKKPSDVVITFSPREYWLKKSDDESKGDFMLVHRIDMSYAGKDDQEGAPTLYISEQEVKIFRKSGFGEID